MAAAPSRPPEHHHYSRGPSPSLSLSASPARRLSELSPPLIAMMAVLATALLIVLYVRLISQPVRRLRRRFTRWRRRRRRSRLSFSSAELEASPAPNAGDYLYYYYSSGASSNYFISPYGLDDSAIKALPLSVFSNAKGKHLYRDCAVCLVEFDDGDSLRTLPICSHVFHADCIDVWLRSHANCPLCRAAIFRQESSPFVPMRAARIRPSFDDLLLNPPPLAPPPLPPPPPLAAEPDYSEIEAEAAAASPARTSREEERFEGRDFLLERSYSFGFERNLAAEQMMMTMESSTASPWRYRQRSFWSKRWPSPFISGGGGTGYGCGSSSSRAARVFSFRSYRGGNAGRSPFARKRGAFFPLSESRAGPSSRRTRSLTSPVSFFSRPWGGSGLPASSVAASGSSRLRCGDPEALLSPPREDELNRRR